MKFNQDHIQLTALDRYLKAAESDPGNAEAWFNFAQTADRLGRPGDAQTAYARFLEIATPDYRVQAEVAARRIRQLNANPAPRGDEP